MNRTYLVSIPWAENVEDLRLSLVTELQRIVERLNTDHTNAQGQRVQNVGKPVAASDAVNLKTAQEMLGQVGRTGGSSTDGPVTEIHLQDTGGAKRPVSTIESPTATGDTRIGRATDSERFDVMVNVSYNGTTFNLDDTSKYGVWLTINPTTVAGGRSLAVYVFTPGANPRTSSTMLVLDSAGQLGVGKTPSHAVDVAGDINCTGSFLVNGSALGYYTKAEVDALLAGKASSTHTHTINFPTHSHTDPQGGTTGTASLGGSTSGPVG